MVEAHPDLLKKDAVAVRITCPNRQHLTALAQDKPMSKVNYKNPKMAVKEILNNENKNNASLRMRRSLILCKVLRTSSIT